MTEHDHSDNDAHGGPTSHPVPASLAAPIVPTGPSYTLHSPLYFWASVVSYGVVLPLALIAAWRRRGTLGATPGLWLLAGSAVAVCLVFFPQERFRIPVIDPTLLILAGTLLSGTWPSRPAAEARVAA